MDFQSFLSEWRGRRIDYNHSSEYLATDLLSEYLFSCYGLKVEFDDLLLKQVWDMTPTGISDKFYAVQDTVLQDGDLVFINDFSHAGIATGEQDAERFELLEQNAVGSRTGIGDDAIRTNFYSKSILLGIFRPRYKAQFVAPVPFTQPEPAPEPEAPQAVVQMPYKAPTGGLKVPLHFEKLYVKTTLKAYSSPLGAASHTQPKAKSINPGSYETDLTKMGMKRLVVPGADETWINPADNVIAPVEPVKQLPLIPVKPQKLDATQDCMDTYEELYDEQTGQAGKQYFVANRDAAVICFGPGPDKSITKYTPVWISGTFIVGEMLYALPTPAADKNLWYGILFSSLTPHSEIYGTKTTLEERRYLRTLSLGDHVTLAKAKFNKTLNDIIGK